MKILAIDTATEACSAALYIDNEVIFEYELAPRQHTQLILPMVDRLLKSADVSLQQLDALSYARGPGAFTGVRIAAGVIQGLSYANDIPVVPVSTLAAMALAVHQQYGHKDILTAIDARMQEVYWAAYHIEADNIELMVDECVSKVENLSSLEKKSWAGVGTGWSAYAEALNEKFTLDSMSIYAEVLPSAEYIVKLAVADFNKGLAVSAHAAQPVYLRDDVAKKKSQQK